MHVYQRDRTAQAGLYQTAHDHRSTTPAPHTIELSACGYAVFHVSFFTFCQYTSLIVSDLVPLPLDPVHQPLHGSLAHTS